MSKGSKSRIGNQAKFNKGFDKIFNKAKDIPELNVEWACYCEKINFLTIIKKFLNKYKIRLAVTFFVLFFVYLIFN